MSETKALAIIPKSIDEVTSLAEVLAKSTLMPDALKNKVPDVVVSILAGQELGLSPMAAIRGVHVVQGKPVLSADTMVALILGSGLAEYFSCVEDTDARVTYETKRRGSPHVSRASWSTEDTKRAGLNTKDNWRLYTKAMMKARAKAALARDAFPDVLAGCHTDDEIERPAQAYTPPADAIDAEVVEPQAIDDLLKRVADAPDIETLKATAKDIADRKLTGDAKATVRAAYDAKSKLLKNPPVQNGHTAEVAQP